MSEIGDAGEGSIVGVLSETFGVIEIDHNGFDDKVDEGKQRNSAQDNVTQHGNGQCRQLRDDGGRLSECCRKSVRASDEGLYTLFSIIRPRTGKHDRIKISIGNERHAVEVFNPLGKISVNIDP